MILPEVVNDESIASNGPGEEYAVGPEGHLDHTPKVARTILVRDSASLTLCFENLQLDTLEGTASIAGNIAVQGMSSNVYVQG